MKRWWLITGILVTVILVAWFFSRPEPVEVTVAHAEQGLVENTVANTRAGTVKSCQRSRLSLAIGGQIDVLNVKEGDKVARGQLLMSLWNKDRAARLKQAEATLLSARNEKNSVCITAKSDMKEARRLNGLVERNLVSAEQADTAHARAEASAASCEAATARVEQASAEVELSAALLAQTELFAPFDGIVAEVTGEIGEYSTPSPPGVATPPAIDLLTDYCHYISAPIDEVDASDIEVGMAVRVTLDAFRGRVFPATIRRIAPYILEQEKQARTVEVEAVLNEQAPDLVLLAGYSADMEIILETRDNVLRVPTELIVDDRYVYVVKANGRLEKRVIEKGLANWRYTEIHSGLSVKENLVTNIGASGVVEDARVTITDQRDD